MIDTRTTQRQRWIPLVPVIAMLTVSGPGVHAAGVADGDLDPTFGKNGRVITNFGGIAADVANDVALQADGRIVVVGETSSPETASDFGLARYNADGTLDSTFGRGGLVATDFGKGGPTLDVANAVAIQSDGKIVVVGTKSNFPFEDFAIARYDTNGRLDATFGVNGKVVASFGESESAHDVALTEDGKLIVVGRHDNAWAIARYNADGSPDTSFDGDGLVLTSFGDNFARAHAVRIQDDGRIVVAGLSVPSSSAGFALARYNVDGSLDTGFGTGGVVETDVAAGTDIIEGLAIQADGKIVAAGVVGNNGFTSTFGVARYQTDGSLDESFGTGGISITTALQSSDARDVALQADGRIVVAGSIFNGRGVDFAVLRLDSNGARDETFGRKGLALAGFVEATSNAFHLGAAVAIQTDGKIVVAGVANVAVAGVHPDFGVVRFNASSR